MASISQVSSTATTVTVQLISLDTSYSKSDRVCSWYLSGSYAGQSDIGANVPSGGTFTFTGLTSGTTYSIYVVINAPGWANSTTLYGSIETDIAATNAYIYTVSSASSSVTVALAGLDTSYAQSNRTCSWYLNGTYKGQSTLGAYISSGGNFTYTGLSSGTTYSIYVVISAPNWANSTTLYGSITTTALSISLWSWTSSNGSATAAQTQAAYNAVTNKGSLSSFSYLVWNDMVDKIYTYRTAKSNGWANNYATYSATLMTSSDKVLTAVRFNSFRYNIGSLYSTGITDVSKGDIIYGSYFITLTDCLNSLIQQG